MPFRVTIYIGGMSMKIRRLFWVMLFAASFAGLLSFVSFAYSVALMIPGEVGGNPIYEMMVSGAKAAASETGMQVKVVEGGYNPAAWEPNLLSLAGTGKYDLIVTFTVSMPSSVEKLANMFPKQKFALLDGVVYDTLPNVYSLGFKDEEMAYLAGYFAGLVTTSKMPYANSDLKIGLLAGDIYPAMMDQMKPAYENAAKAVDPNIKVVFSSAATWADPNKGKELAQAQFNQGVDIIFTIAGGTGVGAVQIAKQMHKYTIGVDSNTIDFAPGTTLACALKHADLAIKNVLVRAYNGKLAFGTWERWGIKEGGIGFTLNDPDYIKFVPETIRENMLTVFNDLKDGKINPLLKR